MSKRSHVRPGQSAGGSTKAAADPLTAATAVPPAAAAASSPAVDAAVQQRGAPVSSTPITRPFRPSEVSRILGLSGRQLQYWAQTDLAPPSITTRGGHHRYCFEDLVALRAAKRLIDAGVSVQRIRSSIRALRSLLPTVQRPLAELVLVATGDVVLVFHEGMAFDAVSGQEWVFEIAQLQREIETWQREVEGPATSRRPASGTSAAGTPAAGTPDAGTPMPGARAGMGRPPTSVRAGRTRSTRRTA